MFPLPPTKMMTLLWRKLVCAHRVSCPSSILSDLPTEFKNPQYVGPNVELSWHQILNLHLRWLPRLLTISWTYYYTKIDIWRIHFNIRVGLRRQNTPMTLDWTPPPPPRIWPEVSDLISCHHQSGGGPTILFVRILWSSVTPFTFEVYKMSIRPFSVNRFLTETISTQFCHIHMYVQQLGNHLHSINLQETVFNHSVLILFSYRYVPYYLY